MHAPGHPLLYGSTYTSSICHSPPEPEVNVNRTSSDNRFPTSSNGSVGCQSAPPSTTPTGSSTGSPNTVRNFTTTFSGATEEPVLRAKKRIVGWATVTQIGAVVAEEPAGRSRDFEPGRYGWLPSTTVAPPARVQAPPVSKPLSGAS